MEETENFGLCTGCLSVDRRVESIGDYVDLFYTLLGYTEKDLKYYYTMSFCWECMALMRRTKEFQRRIINAQHVLQSSLHKNITVKGLSKLTKSKINYTSNDVEQTSIENIKINEEMNNDIAPLKKGLKVLGTIKESGSEIDESTNMFEIELQIKDEIPYGDNKLNIKEELMLYDDFSYDDSIQNIEYKEEIKSKKKSKSKIKKENFKERPLHKFWLQKYKNDMKITKNDIDFNNPHQYFKTTLTSNCKNIVVNEKFMGDYNKMKYKCNECKIGFRTRKRLEIHIRTHDTNEKILKYQCLLCSSFFLVEKNCEFHLKSDHWRVFHCLHCKETFIHLVDFMRHYRTSHKPNCDEIFVCDHCGKSIRKKERIEKHMKIYHLHHKCKECDKWFDSYYKYKRHAKTMHFNASEAEKELSYCVECNKHFKNLYLYRKHVGSVHKPKVKLEVQCKFPGCEKVFSRTNYMKNHYNLMHMKQTKHYCAICDKYYATAFGLRTHIAFVHQKQVVPKTKVCDICGRAFQNNRILAHHVRTHTGERPHVCACGAAFAQQTALKTHIKSRHKYDNVCVPTHDNSAIRALTLAPDCCERDQI